VTNRGFGDYQDNVHAAGTDGASVTFTGTGISLVSQTNSDEGTTAVSLDGTSKGTINANAVSATCNRPSTRSPTCR
jgi:hypothetical protein